MMGKLLEVSNLSEEECDRILQVIQKDFELREQEKKRLSLIKEEVSEESTKTKILAKQKNFNDNCCMRCFRTFVFLIRRSVQCEVCKYNVCKNCCFWNREEEVYVCHVCQRQINLKLQSCDWFYENVRKRFKRFGSAKVLRSLYKRKFESESENDSGYDPSITSNQQDFRKKHLSFQSLFIQESASSDELGAPDEGEVAGMSLDDLKTEELVKFREELSKILKEMDGVLDRHSHGILSEEDQGMYDEAMSTYQAHLRNTLANLVGTLHSAGLMKSEGDEKSSPSHEDIKKLITKQAEHVLGRPVELPIVDPSLSSMSVDSGQPFEDLLSRALVHNVLEKYRDQARTKKDHLHVDFDKLESSTDQALENEKVSFSSKELAAIPSVDEVDLDGQILQEHEVPLPSFTENDNLGEMDPDILSISGTDYSSVLPETDAESHMTWDSESAVSTKSWTGNWFFREKHQVSPYDNFGNKKLTSSDGEDSLLMYVPKANQPVVATVGEKNVDDLSELSDDTLTDDVEDSDTQDAEYSQDILTEYQTRLEEEDEDELESLASFNAAVLDDQEGTFSPRAGSFKLDKKSDSSKKKKHGRKAGDKLETSKSNYDMFELSPAQSSDSSVQSPVQEKHPISTKISTISSKDHSPDNQMEKQTESIIDEEPLETGTEADDPQFVMKPKSVKVPEGETAQVMCEVTGTQPIDVFWYRDNKTAVVQLEDENKYECSVDSNVHTLEVFGTSKVDQGQYMCIVINEMGQSYWTFGIKVEDNPMDTSKPEFLKKINNVEVTEGQSAKLRCKVKGYPPPRLMWFKDGKRIKDSEECRIMKTGNRDYMLYLDAATLNDDAEYSVSARNICGEVKCSAELIVEPAIEVPTVSTPPVSTPPVLKGRSILPFVQSKKLPDHTDTQQDIRVSSGDKTVSLDIDQKSSAQISKPDLQKDSENKKTQSMKKSYAHSMGFQEDILPSSIEEEEALLNEHEKMKTSATAVRKLTSTALQVLNSAEDIVKANSNELIQEPQIKRDREDREKKILPAAKEKQVYGEKRKSHVISPVIEISETQDEEPGTFSQIRRTYKEDLVESGQGSDDVLKIQVGLHRIDSKRYKRDFIVNRKGNQQQKEKGPQKVVESVPKRAPVAEDLAEQEEKIYMTAGKVFSLEDRINRLQHEVQETSEVTSDDEMNYLEDQVAKSVAQVTQRQREVESIETEVNRLKDNRTKSRGSDRCEEIQSSEEDIPESRGEYDIHEYRLPSVKNLREKFKQGN